MIVITNLQISYKQICRYARIEWLFSASEVMTLWCNTNLFLSWLLLLQVYLHLYISSAEILIGIGVREPA